MILLTLLWCSALCWNPLDLLPGSNDASSDLGNVINEASNKLEGAIDHVANDIVEPLAEKIGVTVVPPLQRDLHEVKDGIKVLSGNTGLPVGVIIALAVVIPLVLMGMCCYCCCGCYCRRREKKAAAVYVRMEEGVGKRYEEL